jgi:hypothetical protein
MKLRYVLIPLAMGCTIMNGYSVPTDAGPDTSLPDTADADAGLDVDPCDHARWPDPPEGGAPGTITFLTTARRVSFGLLDDGGVEPVGFDIDGVCTCAFQQGPSCNSPTKACDLDRGVDDAVQALVAEAAHAITPIDFTHDTNDNIVTGANSILAWVEGYNGLADDPAVRVAVLYSPGLYDDAGTQRAPTFTTADDWSVVSDQIASGAVPRRYVSGYVRHSTLVVQGPIDLGLLPGVILNLTQAILVAHIDNPDGGPYILTDGVLGGRANAPTLIRALGRKEQPPGSGKRLCDPNNKDYFGFLALGGALCNARDIMTNPLDDGKGKDCDAISVALTFVGAPASIGPVLDADGGEYCANASVPCQ